MPKILVADDNTNIQKMVVLAFEERHIDVVAVGNGEAAVRRIPDLNPDLILADIFMPVRNGYEVCEFVKKDSRFSHIPVILLVGAFDPLDEKEARRVGADGVLKKPFVPPDPLIAMVVSALEKNPKLAAELAKVREKAPEPEPMPPALEMPVRAEVKPLPEFPEPSPEEAALVYGFGSGKRGMGEAVAEEAGPVAPKAEEVAEEEGDGREHGSGGDWRRNAMDFEIPEETSKSVAFALDDEPPAGMFPSEKEVPPRHVPVRDLAPLPAEKPAVAEAPTQILAPRPQAAEEPPATPFAPAAIVPAAPVSVMPEARAIVPVAAPEELPASSKFEASSHTAGPSLEGSAIEIEPLPESEFAARATHWMDAMSTALKETEQGEEEDWSEPTPTVKMDLDAQAAASVTEKQVEKSVFAEAPSVQPEPLPTTPGQTPDEDEFFADESTGEARAITGTDLQASAPQASDDPALESSGPLPVAAGADPELVAEPDDVQPMAKDPELFESPAVKVTPEPLLVDEATEAAAFASSYDKHEAETASPLELLPPSPTENSDLAEAPAQASQELPIDERIPTGPPPNREVLASIPFLTPPPEFLAAAREQEKATSEVVPTAPSNGSSDEAVDALVRKVLERLEPQLHDILSQNVLKPLVENILHNDLAKKS